MIPLRGIQDISNDSEAAGYDTGDIVNISLFGVEAEDT